MDQRAIRQHRGAPAAYIGLRVGERAVYWAYLEVVSVLDYTKGFAYTDLITCYCAAERKGPLFAAAESLLQGRSDTNRLAERGGLAYIGPSPTMRTAPCPFASHR